MTTRSYLQEAYDLADGKPLTFDGIQLPRQLTLEHLQAVVRYARELEGRIDGEREFLATLRGGELASTSRTDPTTPNVVPFRAAGYKPSNESHTWPQPGQVGRSTSEEPDYAGGEL